jgi:TonB family protein
MKKVLLLTLGVIAFIAASAQKKQNVYFLKNNLPVVDRDSADLIRIIQEPDSGSTLYVLYEYYHNKQRKTVGTLTAFDPVLEYEGLLASFYENGKPKSSEQYTNNILSGNALYYFENGTLEKSVEYLPFTESGNEIKLVYLADSSGHVLVKDGNGHVLPATSDPNVWQEEGDYVNGKKQGIWTTTKPALHSSYKETFDQGKFIKGESLVDGVSYTYKETEESPMFKGGVPALFKQLRSYLSNLTAINQSHITGEVLVSFVIERDGSLSEAKVVKSLDSALDKIALQFVKSSPKWLPARQHGIPQRVQFTMPVNFDGQ